MTSFSFARRRVGVTGNQTITGSLRVDSTGLNNGAVFGVPALTFGNSVSGEGIASKRTAGGNQYALDFYTQLQQSDDHP